MDNEKIAASIVIYLGENMKNLFFLLMLVFPMQSFAALDCEFLPTPACLPQYNSNSYEASHNKYQTILQMKNKGGYNTRFRVSYKDGENGNWKKFSSPSLPLGSMYTVKVPGHASYVKIDAELHTGFGWKKMYTEKVCRGNNQWTLNNKNENVYQVDNWGTTLWPSWSSVQPLNTHYNGSDKLGCWV
ncbi:hypothetical protein OQE61_14025 [Cetobacterium somerae]|uniref:hypothetical protein n=1 Tax=Cetobacterium somerae TaxID=188913 RepID=UPI00224EF1D6|nr:hypothetical protein [Cetobacterium somerae]MCX3068617.1 hypothetical protein [Cetobacterium somerae]